MMGNVFLNDRNLRSHTSGLLSHKVKCMFQPAHQMHIPSKRAWHSVTFRCLFSAVVVDAD